MSLGIKNDDDLNNIGMFLQLFILNFFFIRDFYFTYK